MKLNFWSDQSSEATANEIQECTRSIWKHNDRSKHNNKDKDSTIELWFSEVVFDKAIAEALHELFRTIDELPTWIISRFKLDRCAGNVHLNQCLRDALEYDAVEALCVDGRFGSYDVLTDSPLGLPLDSSTYNNRSSSSNRSRRRRDAPPLRLVELDLRYFELSVPEVDALRNGILNPGLRRSGGGLQRLSLCNISFADDVALDGLSEALSLLSQKQTITTTNTTTNDQEHEHGRYLETLWLYYCNLEDEQMERIIRSLMEVNSLAGTEPEPIRRTTTSRIESGWQSTLKSLMVEQGKCGTKFYDLLGVWLLDVDLEDESISPPLLSHNRCSCYLESIVIFIWTALAEYNFPDPVASFTKGLAWDDPIPTTRKKTNRRLKTLKCSGVDDMRGLGRLVSEHFLGLESLQLNSRGTNDFGVTLAGLEDFVQGSGAPGARGTNLSLRSINFHCSEKSNRLALESSQPLEDLLDRYHMLHDVKFGFKRNGSWNDKIQHKMNLNAAGRFFFVPSSSTFSAEDEEGNGVEPQSITGLPIGLWPRVLEAFHKRLQAESESMYDERIQGWVESGSMGSDDEDDSDDDEDDNDYDSDNDNDDNDNNNDNDIDENDTVDTANDQAADPSEEDSTTESSAEDFLQKSKRNAVEQSASAIFSLLYPNIARQVLLSRQQEGHDVEKPPPKKIKLKDKRRTTSSLEKVNAMSIARLALNEDPNSVSKSNFQSNILNQNFEDALLVSTPRDYDSRVGQGNDEPFDSVLKAVAGTIQEWKTCSPKRSSSNEWETSPKREKIARLVM